MDKIYIIKYCDIDGNLCWSEPITDLLSVLNSAKRLNGIIYERYEKKVDLDALKQEFMSERAEIDKFLEYL